MVPAGKMLVIVGLAVALLGVLLWVMGKAGFRGLPGDIRYESDHVRFYFPIITCLVISALLTLGLWIWRWLIGR
jgi:hypothetical protein